MYTYIRIGLQANDMANMGANDENESHDQRDAEGQMESLTIRDTPPADA